MTKQQRFDKFYMGFALDAAKFSYCKRKQVGAVFVKDETIIIGYNGTISGDVNECEDCNGETKPDVYHAEENIFRKIMRSPITSVGGTVFCTLSPCFNCAKLIVGAGITRFVFLKKHSDQSGVEFMIRNNIIVEQMEVF